MGAKGPEGPEGVKKRSKFNEAVSNIIVGKGESEAWVSDDLKFGQPNTRTSNVYQASTIQ